MWWKRTYPRRSKSGSDTKTTINVKTMSKTMSNKCQNNVTRSVRKDHQGGVLRPDGRCGRGGVVGEGVGSIVSEGEGGRGEKDGCLIDRSGGT